MLHNQINRRGAVGRRRMDGANQQDGRGRLLGDDGQQLRFGWIGLAKDAGRAAL